MLEMINKEKAAAFEGTLTTDGLAMMASYGGEGGLGEGVGNDVVNGAAVASAQQEKAIQEMDLAIAEKEEILTKLLDTVRGIIVILAPFHMHSYLIIHILIFPLTHLFRYPLTHLSHTL